MVKNRFKIGISLAIIIVIFLGCSNQPDTKIIKKLEIKKSSKKIEKTEIKKSSKEIVNDKIEQQLLEEKKRLEKLKQDKIEQAKILEQKKILEKQKKLEKEKKLQRERIIYNIEKDFKNKISKLYTGKYSAKNRVIKFSDNIKSWIDVDTGFIWEVKTKQNINDEYNWYNAKRYCSDLVLDGYSDWRLPNIDELKTLLTKNEYNRYYIKKPLSYNTNSYYWSATAYLDIAYFTWGVNFYYRYDNGINNSVSDYVRCVRIGDE